MSNSVSKYIGRGLLVAVLSVSMVGGLAYQDTAMAGASKAAEKNQASPGRFPGCCGAPSTGVGNGGSPGNGGGGGNGGNGGGGGSEDQF